MATAILQVRLGSTRLPGKALLPILEKPMVWYTIQSLKISPAVERIVLAIPDNPKDEPLVKLARECDVNWIRGSEDNVLQRFYQAALKFKDDYYFRCTGDNPIIDVENPKRTLSHLKAHNLHYVVENGLPKGSVVEGFTFNALEKAYREGKSPEDIEHVTWYIKKSGRFNIAFIKPPQELIWPQLRLTVDYPEDFQRIKYIIQHLYKGGIPPFSKVLAFVRKEKLN